MIEIIDETVVRSGDVVRAPGKKPATRSDLTAGDQIGGGFGKRADGGEEVIV